MLPGEIVSNLSGTIGTIVVDHQHAEIEWERK
jgi:hypothetical protein